MPSDVKKAPKPGPEKQYLYLLSQSECRGYDTYSSCVVVAPSASQARRIHPAGSVFNLQTKRFCDVFGNDRLSDSFSSDGSWPADPKFVKAERIGVALKNQKSLTVVCASFHAG